MYEFKHDPDISLLTVTRTGLWSVDTVRLYEVFLRAELAKLARTKRPTSFIIDIRGGGLHAPDVADALREMVARLGPLHADRTAVVTSSGLAKLQARRVADPNAEVFTSMVLARDWVTDCANPAGALPLAQNEPSDADAEGPYVHVHGPSDVDVTFTPAAALETAKRIGDAATEVLIGNAKAASLQASRAF